MAHIDLQSLPEYKEVPPQDRFVYLLNFVRSRHRKHMDFILHSAKLRIKHNLDTWAGWNNVMEHNVMESVAMQVLCEDLGLKKNEALRLENYVFLHNPFVCVEKYHAKIARGKMPEDIPEAERFTEEEERELHERYEKFLWNLDPFGDIETALTPEYFQDIGAQYGDTIEEKADQMTLESRLVYYVDALFDDGNLLPAHVRIAKMEQTPRGREVANDPSFNVPETQNGETVYLQYWDAERRVSTHIQKTIWEMLRESGIELPSHEDVPEYLRKRVGQKMLRLPA